MPLEKFDDLVILKNLKQTAVTNNDIVTAVCFMFLILVILIPAIFEFFLTELTKEKLLSKMFVASLSTSRICERDLSAMINEFAFEF